MMMRYCTACQQDTAALVCPIHGLPTLPCDETTNLGPDPMLGQVVAGRFRIQSLLGEGGMGRVYRAVQLSVERAVAIKVLKTRYAGDPRVLARFQREARATSLLRHPNTIQIIDFGQTSAGHPYLATELLVGRSLEAALEVEGRLALSRAVHIAVQVLRSLTEAHRAGLVHRDIKSSNIFLCTVDEDRHFAKLLDFGVARFVDGPEGLHKLTRTGCIVGTPAYMSPEQAQGKTVDARSDLYSVAVVLYEMLTGRLPFSATTMTALQLAHAFDEAPPIGVPGDGVPESIARVVMGCLKKFPGDRPKTADALRLALEEALSDYHRDAMSLALAATAPLLPVAPLAGPTENDTVVDMPAILLDPDTDLT